MKKNYKSRNEKRRTDKVNKIKSENTSHWMIAGTELKNKMKDKWNSAIQKVSRFLHHRKKLAREKAGRFFAALQRVGLSRRLSDFKLNIVKFLAERKDRLKELGVNKVMVGAISFSLLMFAVGTYAIFDYYNESKVLGAEIIEGEMLTGSLVAQNNPLILASTTIGNAAHIKEADSFGSSVELQSNSIGKLPINPAVSPIIASTKEQDKPKEGDFVEVSLAPSIRTMQDDLKNIQVFDAQKEVYDMLIDGNLVASFENPEDPKLVIDAVIARNTDSNAELLEVSYKQNLQIKKHKKSFLSLNDPPTVDDAVSYISTGTKERQKYTIVAGDIPESIAEAHGMTVDELEAANPQIVGKGHLLQIGQVLDLSIPVPMLTVVTKEKLEYNDLIDFEVTEEKNPDMYEDEKKIKVAGVKGKKQIVAQVIRENGREVSRQVISEEVVSEPVGQVLVVGTKKAPPRQGSGTFIVPIARSYRYESGFGPRWGRFHRGVDLSCPIGTPILAADGGTVVYSGYNKSYGYYVKINHGGNVATLYAHCSALFVSGGQKVFKGQHIANVGNTGNSTGPHLHFEVIKNGTNLDPAKFIF